MAACDHGVGWPIRHKLGQSRLSTSVSGNGQATHCGVSADFRLAVCVIGGGAAVHLRVSELARMGVGWQL